ncbi:methylenetetrahydrofolate reductase [Convivina intestini]|uniref:Methylenetetrahydrofolate reductase n=1 Tax=Convivina intestini TaxID=1505726 RepID=A0A2U1DBI0_9LACO|nr:methylenetetrahydrofolate reductase [Convivina intestini]PVY85021.1 5,10-methylenetetrahydrofolate reductase [Convivina intestini]CAH1853428.1 hypothetical protein R077811_00694 [Convivina intestini]SDB89313.1 5,10-methylenetetrahydrofolate reductase [Leuconostocaceae bacterium R-53105]
MSNHLKNNLYQNQLIFSMEVTVADLKRQDTVKKINQLTNLQYLSLVNHTKNDQEWQELLTAGQALQMRTQRPLLLHLPAGTIAESQIQQKLIALQENQLDHLLIMRGDRVAPAANYHSATSLLKDINKSAFNFDLGATVDPNKIATLGLPALLSEIDTKIAAGAEFLITQIFFDLGLFKQLQEALQQRYPQIPLIAGVFPVMTVKQGQWIENNLGQGLPVTLTRRLMTLPADPQLKQYWCGWLKELLLTGPAGVHFFAGIDIDFIKELMDIAY